MSYDNATATAKRLLARRGKRVTMTRPDQGAINEIAGTRASGGGSTSIFNCVGLPANGRSAETRIGSLIDRKLQMFYMARVSGTLVPEPGDELPFGGKTWKLIWTATYNPDDSGPIFSEAYGEIG